MAKKFVLDRRLRTGFAVAICLIVLVGVMSYLTFRSQQHQAQLVKQTYQIINKTEFIQKTLIDMESGRRGFRVTNDQKFLQPYYLGFAEISPSLANLNHQIKDYPQLQKSAKELQVVIDSMIHFWELLPKDASQYTPAERVAVMNAEKVRMDKVRTALDTLQMQVNQLMQVEENENINAINRAIIALTISILLILLIVGILIYRIIKEFKSRIKAEKQLNQNNDDLVLANIETAQQNWLLAGLAEVNNALQNEDDLTKLTHASLSSLLQYLDADAGGFYLYNSDKHELLLTASYAFPAKANQTYQLKEGLVGQAAVSEEPLHLKKIPPQHITIDSGLVKATPAEAVYASITLQGEIKGVLELMRFGSFDDSVLKLLGMVKNNIAVAIHSAQSRQKVAHLLAQVQRHKEVLENQQEELRQVNEELTAQTDVLQASEEEMRVQEEELRQINAELEEKNETIEAARITLIYKSKELEEISRYKSEFLANMSHELRTPLNSILILAKLLADNTGQNLSEKQISHAKIIYKSGSDLLQLINDILDLSKIEAGKMEVYFTEEKVENITSSMHQLFAMVAEERNIHFDIQVDEGVPSKITTDTQKLNQVLSNLLSNAFKFTEAKGNVTLHLSSTRLRNAEALQFIITDTGIGIPADKQQLIFDAFQQADSSTNRKYGGTGLGLSIIRRLVPMLGGQIEVSSEETVGSTFKVTIPVGPLQTEESSKILPPANKENIDIQQILEDDKNQVVPGDDLMLIIEDDAPLAKIIRDFAHSKNYKAIVAFRGDEGLFLAKKYIPSVIILDLILPVMDGSTVLRHLKADPSLQHIPVHIISAFKKENSTDGAFSFLQKPFHLYDLEHAFTQIDNYLTGSSRRVLILSNNEENRQAIENLLKQKEPKIAFDVVDNAETALTRLKARQYQAILADLSGNYDSGFKDLQWISEQTSQRVHAIVYIDEDISSAKELELKKVADVVVRKSAVSHNRLMDELELFLYKVKEDKKEQPEPIELPRNAYLLTGKKVLLVDDDMRNVFALNAALEQEKMQVVVAADGREAIEMLQQQKDIAIVLMDVMMPEMDGYEAMRIIRNELGLQKLPVIALTAKAMAGDKQKCIEAGASDYITKPVNVQQLFSLMRVWLA